MWIKSAPGSELFISPGDSLKNQVRFASHWDLSDDWQFDLDLRYVDNLPALNVPSYITMDMRLAWLPRKKLEFAVIGRNLLDSRHWEFAESQPIFLLRHGNPSERLRKRDLEILSNREPKLPATSKAWPPGGTIAGGARG